MPHTTSIQNIGSTPPSLSSRSTPEINGLILKAKISNGEAKLLDSEIFIDSEKLPQPLITKFAKDYQELKTGVFLSDRTLSLDLASRFDSIQIKKEKGGVIEILKEIEPRLKEIVLGQEGVIYADLGLDSLIPVQLLGDGLKKILAVVLSIMDTKGGIVLIDELENGLYYKSQQILWKAITKTSKKYGVQVIATTHSLETVKAFSSIIDSKTKGNLYRIENKGDTHEVIRFDEEKVHSFIKNNWEMR